MLSRFRRSRSDRKVAGVCGGLGAGLGIDPLVLRVVFVLLTVFGGAGILAYALAWLLLAEPEAAEAPAEALVRGRGDSSVVLPIVGVVVGIAAFGHTLGNGPTGFVVVLTLLALAAVVAVGGEGRRVPPPAAPRQPDAFGRTAGTAYATPGRATGFPAPPAPPTTPAAGPGWTPPPVPARQPRPRSAPLLVLTVTGAVLLAAAATVLALAAGEPVGSGWVLGLLLVGVGGGLAVASVWGRPGLLPGLGVVLAAALVLTTAVRDDVLRDTGSSVGSVRFHPLSAADVPARYEHAVGSTTVDLRDLPLTGGTQHVAVASGVGRVLVLLPRTAKVDVTAEVRLAGQIDLPGEVLGGTDHLREHLVLPGTSAGTLDLDLDLSIGHLEVRR
ncbi:phage shock protein C (PspC) family protein [Motilibacter rhizosphaerae]|uniref:Phage shock protein C (PspC) family protein n=1 Tax=Motilibacter rhizosphaerae TaxID=598652 RepID=A0A4Q7NTC0_9ACTN|nr:phage shock protein C (PspC) family protein [Motilibacter rhizosphaerae]